MSEKKWCAKPIYVMVALALVLTMAVISNSVSAHPPLDKVNVYNATGDWVGGYGNITAALDHTGIGSGWIIRVADSYDSAEPAWPVDVDVAGVTIASNSTPTIDPAASGQGALMISASNVTIDGGSTDGLIIKGGSQAYDASNPQEHTIWVAANYSTIKNCKIINYRGNQACIYIGGRTANVPSPAIYGYQVSQPKGHTIENNTFRVYHAGEGWGIFAYDLSDDCSIKGNRFVGDADDAGNYTPGNEGAPGTGIIIHSAEKGSGTNAIVIEDNTALYIKYTWLTFYAAYQYVDAIGYGYEQPENSTVEDVVVRNNTVHNCKTAINFHRAKKSDAYGVKGADLTVGSGKVVIGSDNEFYDNDYGVVIDDPREYSSYACVQNPDNIQIKENNIYDSACCGVGNGAGAGVANQTNGGTVDAENNWWGDASGPYDPNGTTEVPPCTDNATADRNADGAGDNVTDNVDYCPWLGEQYAPTKSTGTATGTGTASFSPDAGALEALTAVHEATLPTAGKPNLDFPHGFFSFNITGLTPCAGETVTVTITLPSAVSVGTQYWKYHASEGGWIQIPMGSDDGDNVITITLQDGGLGDDDGVCNGVIEDQGGPGNPRPPVGGTAYPENMLTILAPWAALGAAIIAGATIFVRRRGAQS